MLGRQRRVFLLPRNSAASLTQRCGYVDVKMKWKKDPFFDSVDVLARSRDLRPLFSLKNILASAPTSSGVPISAVSKCGRELKISGRVASFLRRYPAVFQEFTGPMYNLPWFKLTPEAAALDREERAVYDARRPDIALRLRRLLLMSREHMLPLTVVQGMLWNLGLPEDFLKNPEEITRGRFMIVEIGDGKQGLALIDGGDKPLPLSVLQRNAMMQLGGLVDSPSSAVVFPLFPSKGLRLKRKIEYWLEEFQKLPYVSPYEDSSGLDPNSNVSEKRVAGVLHELLSLFVDNTAERRRLLCLKKHLGLPQKFHKVFERHPHVFYLLLKDKTCYVVLKEAYSAGSNTALEQHPMLEVRKKYIKLMDKSDIILRRRRCRKPVMEVAEECHDADANYEQMNDSDGINMVKDDGINILPSKYEEKHESI